MRMMLSIIIPTYNEARNIAASLQPLQAVRAQGHQIIVADGGSTDDTVDIAAPLVDDITRGEKGRARQMNAGARLARGEVLVFLHADTLLPNAVDRLIMDGLRGTRSQWGRFDVRLDGEPAMLRVVERLMNLRSRLTGIATGDQCLFMTREAFAAVGGFPEIALMEDIAMSARLKRLSRPACLKAKAVTSARRWEERGIVRTIVAMWLTRLSFFFGADPALLARRYYGR
jgi:rSAM/selenodomain-associated transferase 2